MRVCEVRRLHGAKDSSRRGPSMFIAVTVSLSSNNYTVYTVQYHAQPESTKIAIQISQTSQWGFFFLEKIAKRIAFASDLPSQGKSQGFSGEGPFKWGPKNHCDLSPVSENRNRNCRKIATLGALSSQRKQYRNKSKTDSAM